ncbi:MAG: 2-C-methyl-D-erythritol 2,4-cyclodiphosphate synthase [Candidatus Omnitrophica bacterium CG11_big_fil_rev_8_21_14_0_20_45_26]|uniref:2-C-methyl-D-erythritol 2,4-cyclodiphosphate synthase n=1 Tax=Candidatus Abzuiibacterium crystallinum TaxID=1974748 RepID=A0A2H0LL39_9BACT|nr:MAG: 2-C-methyl-D-erythritol 2,4-cyclodiphosphate synthase [Candidatus Omnitrophica bacterium CG11_big_fil_rev_8_21_14_0_20_45_26]PIW63775.1 MAG: 2-C-methyl-D-erythritol 2,4-cyclodiphosphate synthase [Candidatus Omnitrophica bacterium CG12_big_fil_rev_8_21_14_0_65_45_16]
MMPSISLIIPAAGASRRFQKSLGKLVPSKLLLPLNGTSVLGHAINAFRDIREIREIIIAADPALKKEIKAGVLRQLKPACPVRLVNGGGTRAESVWHALRRVSPRSTHVMVHDGARPQVQPAWIRTLIQKAAHSDGAVLGRNVVPTVKRIDQNRQQVLETLDRRELFEAETPQIFKKAILVQAYRQLKERALHATDDASLVEMIGGRVQAVSHPGFNVKITTADDFAFVKQSFAKSASQPFFGLGFDRHRLAAKRPFYLGGVRIKAPFGPLGHSDGDPLLHAVIDGMLGALGMGDIGDFFSDQNKKYKNISSSLLAQKALAMVQAKGFQVIQIDATIFLERPKLQENKKRIQAKVSRLFGLPAERVGIKAKTAEGLGPEGKSEAVSAQALVVLSRREGV